MPLQPRLLPILGASQTRLLSEEHSYDHGYYYYGQYLPTHGGLLFSGMVFPRIGSLFHGGKTLVRHETLENQCEQDYRTVKQSCCP